MTKLEEECESVGPGLKGAMAPPPPPNRDTAVGTSAASGPGDNLATIVSTPLALAEHVNSLVLCLCCRVRASAPDGSSPRVYRRLFIVVYRLKPHCLSLSSTSCMIGCATALPMGVAPESICDLAQSGMDSEPASSFSLCAFSQPVTRDLLDIGRCF